MRVTLLPSAFPPPREESNLYLTTFIVNDVLAVDAGSLGLYLSPHDQARIKHVLLTHTHLDHIATLPIFIDNAYEAKKECVVVHGSTDVLDCLQRDMFNGRVWPDYVALGRPEAPFVCLEPVRPGRTFECAGLRVTPVPVNHAVPTLGYILEDDSSAVVITSDTGPTEEIWDRANSLKNLTAVFLEASFPNSMTFLAELSYHLTPALFAEEVAKLRRSARVVAVHIKARFRDEVVRELMALELPNLEVVRPGHRYEF